MILFIFSRIILTSDIMEPLNYGPDFIPFGKLHNMRLHVEIEKMISKANSAGIINPLWKVEVLLHKGNRIKRTNLPQRLIIALNNFYRIKEIVRGFCVVDEEHYHWMAVDTPLGPEFRSIRENMKRGRIDPEKTPSIQQWEDTEYVSSTQYRRV
ncbi:hypothetical protein ACOME3_002067 [Neoechinorhynchus agilis]